MNFMGQEAQKGASWIAEGKVQGLIGGDGVMEAARSCRPGELLMVYHQDEERSASGAMPMP